MIAGNIANNTVNDAQVRWSKDGETITCGAVQLGMVQLRQLIQHELEAARTILVRDLCFGIEPPTYPIGELRDNWDIVKPGHNFLIDSRNE